MLLGGLQKNSLIDYPGKVSCVLFVSGCNFDCPYCHNPDLVKGSSRPRFSLDVTAAYDFLEARKGFLDGVVISGGEPTHQTGLVGLCERVKHMGYPVKLDTNGSRPQVIAQLIDNGLVDYIAMDIKTDVFHYSTLTKKDIDPDDLFTSIQIIMESALAYEFRTTCVKPLVNAHVIQSIVKNIEGAMLYALQRFNNTEILHPEFFLESGAGYDDAELMHLRSIAEPWVSRCIVR
jgi:pyruvate formate lyase activating enzyme